MWRGACVFRGGVYINPMTTTNNTAETLTLTLTAAQIAALREILSNAIENDECDPVCDEVTGEAVENAHTQPAREVLEALWTATGHAA